MKKTHYEGVGDNDGYFEMGPSDASNALQSEIDTLKAKDVRLKRIVNQQAKDDGLWFRAISAPEQYLQMELRKLHKAIEGSPKINDEYLPGRRFMAFKSLSQRYTGLALVIRQKKGGMFECQGLFGFIFEETKTRIVTYLVDDDNLT